MSDSGVPEISVGYVLQAGKGVAPRLLRLPVLSTAKF
jgi:hypothetical protein